MPPTWLPLRAGPQLAQQLRDAAHQPRRHRLRPELQLGQPGGELAQLGRQPQPPQPELSRIAVQRAWGSDLLQSPETAGPGHGQAHGAGTSGAGQQGQQHEHEAKSKNYRKN